MAKTVLKNNSIVVLLTAVILLPACDSVSENNQLDQIASGIFSHCENTFVVSGSRKIYLFEHQPQSVKFNKLAVFDDWAPLSAFLDCANRRIIAPYGARKNNRNDAGVGIIDLESGKKTDYPIVAQGIQGIPVKYRNGILLSTTLLKHTKPSIMSPSYGYLPPGESYQDTQGLNYRLFAPTVYFDLTSLQFTQYLDLDLGYSVIKDYVLYAKQRGAITAIDLQKKTTDVLYELTINSTQSKASNIPLNHLGVFLDSNYYMALNRHSQNNSKGKLDGFEKNAIYKLVNGSMVKLATYPFDDAVYLIGVESKLYIFTNSFNVIEYDLKTQKLAQKQFSSLQAMAGYSIESVGYTHQNFILTLDNQQSEISSKVVLISRDLTQISSPKSVDLRLISVTSDLAIDTSDSRGIQLPVNQNLLIEKAILDIGVN